MNQWWSLGVSVAMGLIVIVLSLFVVKGYKGRKKQKCVTEFDCKLEAVDKVLTNAETTSADLTKVLDELEDLSIDYPDNPEVLCRLGETHYKVSEQSQDLNSDDRKKHIKRGIKTCQRALKLKPKFAAADKWLAKLLDAASHQDEQQPSSSPSPKNISGDLDVDSKNSEVSDDSCSYNKKHFEQVMANADEQFERNSNHLEVCNTAYFLETVDKYDYPENAEVLWRLGKAYYYMCFRSPPSNTKNNTINKAIKCCERAIELNPKVANAHKWLAILIGLRLEGECNSFIKYNDAVLLKKHVNIALKLNPNDYYLYHLLGRYDYWLAGLSLFERRDAGLLFREISEPSYEEVLENLLKAERMSIERFKANQLMIGRCYIALKDYKTAVDWLKKAKEIPSRNYTETVDHSILNAEIQTLLDKYNIYL